MHETSPSGTYLALGLGLIRVGEQVKVKKLPRVGEGERKKERRIVLIVQILLVRLLTALILPSVQQQLQIYVTNSTPTLIMPTHHERSTENLVETSDEHFHKRCRPMVLID